MSHTDEPRTMFSQQLASMTRGSVDAHLTDQMAELVRAIMETHKGGEITLKLKLKPEVSAHEVAQITVTPEISTKMPSEKQMPSLFYPTAQGDLLRNDPRQTEIPGVQDVSAPAQTPVNVPDNKPERVDIDG